MGTSALIYVNATESIRAGNLECSSTSTAEKYRGILHAESERIVNHRSRVATSVRASPPILGPVFHTHNYYLCLSFSLDFVVIRHPHFYPPSCISLPVLLSYILVHFLLGINTFTATVTDRKFCVHDAVLKSAHYLDTLIYHLVKEKKKRNLRDLTNMKQTLAVHKIFLQFNF